MENTIYVTALNGKKIHGESRERITRIEDIPEKFKEEFAKVRKSLEWVDDWPTTYECDHFILWDKDNIYDFDYRVLDSDATGVGMEIAEDISHWVEMGLIEGGIGFIKDDWGRWFKK